VVKVYDRGQEKEERAGRGYLQCCVRWSVLSRWLRGWCGSAPLVGVCDRSRWLNVFSLVATKVNATVSGRGRQSLVVEGGAGRCGCR
jgi:hypothetical protein